MNDVDPRIEPRARRGAEFETGIARKLISSPAKSERLCARWSFCLTAVHSNMPPMHFRPVSMCTVAAENDHRAHWGACILRNSPILYRKHVVLYIDVDGTLDFFCRPVNFDIAFRYDDPFR